MFVIMVNGNNDRRLMLVVGGAARNFVFKGGGMAVVMGIDVGSGRGDGCG